MCFAIKKKKKVQRPIPGGSPGGPLALLFNKPCQHLVALNNEAHHCVGWLCSSGLGSLTCPRSAGRPLEAAGSNGVSLPCVAAGSLLVGEPRPGGLVSAPRGLRSPVQGAGAWGVEGGGASLWRPGLQVHSLTLATAYWSEQVRMPRVKHGGEWEADPGFRLEGLPKSCGSSPHHRTPETKC